MIGGGGGGGRVGGVGSKLTPHLDEQGTKTLNLTVLQRVDPFINEILITSAHVTLYEFNLDSAQWSRKDVEGSLFVVKRNTQPRFQFIVMNRRSTENLVEDLLGDFEFEIQVPYLLYRNAAQEVNGIWFYNSRECEEVGNLFSRILSAFSKVSPKAPVILGKGEFEELEAVPTSSVIEGPLEPPYPPPVSTEPEDPSFLNFFSTAMNVGDNSSRATDSAKFYQAPVQTVSTPSCLPGVTASTPLTLSVPTAPVPASSAAPIAFRDISDPLDNSSRVAKLVKPSSFLTPSSTLLIPPTTSHVPTSILHPPLSLQQSQGSSMPNPFPPPSPPPSLAPYPSAVPNSVTIDREKVRDALLVLVQDNQFIDMVYQALVKAHK